MASRLLGVLFAVILGLLLAGCGGKQLVSKDKFDQLKQGMTYTEVVNLIGAEGTEIPPQPGPANVPVPDIAKSAKVYKWANSDGSYAQVVVDKDSKVISFTQKDLK